MQRRLELHELLCDTLGSRNVYYQPPPSLEMIYPAFVYELEDIKSTFANDGVYLSKRKYRVTSINEDPDNPMVARLAALPFSSFNRHFESDNLNHDVFTLYF